MLKQNYCARSGRHWILLIISRFVSIAKWAVGATTEASRLRSSAALGRGLQMNYQGLFEMEIVGQDMDTKYVPDIREKPMFRGTEKDRS